MRSQEAVPWLLARNGRWPQRARPHPRGTGFSFWRRRDSGHTIVDRLVSSFTLCRMSACLSFGISILGMKPNRKCHL